MFCFYVFFVIFTVSKPTKIPQTCLQNSPKYRQKIAPNTPLKHPQNSPKHPKKYRVRLFKNKLFNQSLGLIMEPPAVA